MPTLILSGGKGKNFEKDIFKLFLKKVKDSPILYIPIAKEDSERAKKSYEWFTTNVSKNITMLTDLSEKINLKNFKGIYIGGGNTFKLLKEIKEKHWENKLKSFKGVIYGGSAGAIIWGKDISTAAWGTIKDSNKVKLKDLSGLNGLNGYNIRAHYLKKEEQETKNFVKKTKIPIIALPEDSGILVENNKILPINKIKIFK